MKTRASSLTEKMIFYSAGGGLLFIMVVAVIFISGFYNKQIDDIKNQEQMFNQQKNQLEAEIQGLEIELKSLDAQFERRVKLTQEEEAEYERIKIQLEQAKTFLPPEHIKSEIMKKIIEKANQENLTIIHIDQIIESGMEKYDFKPVTFELVLEGDYFRVKEFLFFLEQPMKIIDLKDKNIEWNVLLKIPFPHGFGYYRFSMDPEQDGSFKQYSPAEYSQIVNEKTTNTITVEMQDDSQGRRAGAAPQETVTQTKTVFDESLMRTFISQSRERMIKDQETSTLKVKVLVKTYFVREE
ncbi:MAG: hypothetical protein WC337_02185 [Candidatus Muiribacteriota bacterium]